MVSSLICAVLFAATPFQQPQRQNLLARVIPHPTGANGYEEYLRAAEIASDAMNGVYDSWSPNSDMADSLGPSDPRLPLMRRLSGMAWLDVRKEQVKRFGDALDLIRKGNEKGIQDPHIPLTPDTLLPEFVYFKKISRLFIADAYTKFAEGKSAAATRDYVDGLTFSYNISNGSLISTLVGIAVSSVILADCSDRLGNLSLDDCRSLEQISKRLLQARPPIIASMEGERQMQVYSITYLLTKGSDLVSSMVSAESKEGPDYLRRLQKSTPAQRQKWQDSTLAIVNGFFDMQIKKFAQPEAHWFGTDDDLEAWARQDSDPMVRFLVTTLSPTFDQSAVAAARNRTQVRLLYLHSRILQYHWLYNRFPSRLSEIGSEIPLKDPLSGEDFAYEPKAGGYRLYSKGVELTGEIEMRYRGPVRQDGAPNPVLG